MTPEQQKELRLRVVSAQGAHLKNKLDDIIRENTGLRLALTRAIPREVCEQEDEIRNNLNARLAQIERDEMRLYTSLLDAERRREEEAKRINEARELSEDPPTG